MIPVLLVTLAFQLLLSAVNIDLQAIPQQPINDGPLLAELGKQTRSNETLE
jgi:hypothetical protein